MKKILLLLTVMCITTSYGQNKGVILGQNFIPDITGFTTPQSLPTSSTPLGYQGQLPQYAQNIQVNDAGEIVFFIQDATIYGRNGEMIDVMDAFASYLPYLNPIAEGICSEHTIIPDPSDCNAGRFN